MDKGFDTRTQHIHQISITISEIGIIAAMPLVKKQPKRCIMFHIQFTGTDKMQAELGFNPIVRYSIDTMFQ